MPQKCGSAGWSALSAWQETSSSFELDLAYTIDMRGSRVRLERTNNSIYGKAHGKWINGPRIPIITWKGRDRVCIWITCSCMTTGDGRETAVGFSRPYFTGWQQYWRPLVLATCLKNYTLKTQKYKENKYIRISQSWFIELNWFIEFFKNIDTFAVYMYKGVFDKVVVNASGGEADSRLYLSLKLVQLWGIHQLRSSRWCD